MCVRNVVLLTSKGTGFYLGEQLGYSNFTRVTLQTSKLVTPQCLLEFTINIFLSLICSFKHWMRQDLYNIQCYEYSHTLIWKIMFLTIYHMLYKDMTLYDTVHIVVSGTIFDFVAWCSFITIKLNEAKFLI